MGSDYLTVNNKPRIHTVLISDAISEQSLKVATSFITNNNLVSYNVPANIITSLYPGKAVRMLVITSREASKKIANIMKEGETYE